MKNVNLKVKGMHCPSCEMLIEDVLGDENGVESCKASRENNSVSVEFDEKLIDENKIKELIKAENYEVE